MKDKNALRVIHKEIKKNKIFFETKLKYKISFPKLKLF